MKLKASYVCQQCGYDAPEWLGKCPSCGTWNSMVEMVREKGQGSLRHSSGLARLERDSRTIAKPVKLSQVKHIEKNRLKSGFAEFDRALGGGIVPGSVTLLSGDPGIGKSTLLLHVLSEIGGLYITGEESAEQVKLRSKRLNINGSNISVLAETNVDIIAGNVLNKSQKTNNYDSRSSRWNLIIVDSIQTLYSDDLTSMAGSVGQVRYSAEKLLEIAKVNNFPIILVGHVTKEGNIAGPKHLEHMVDTVLYLEGERFSNARILKTLKNRFGAVEEVGIFEMRKEGLIQVSNPSKLFLKDRMKNVSGSCVTVLMEGTRPVLVEIQALTVPSQLAMPRRVSNGFDYNRLQLLIAILQKRLNVPLGAFDVFVNVSGGIKIDEPSADLAVVASVYSAVKNKVIPPNVCMFGEVGLMGEIRLVQGEDIRTKEAKRLNFINIISSLNTKNITRISQIIK